MRRHGSTALLKSLIHRETRDQLQSDKANLKIDKSNSLRQEPQAGTEVEAVKELCYLLDLHFSLGLLSILNYKT